MTEQRKLIRLAFEIQQRLQQRQATRYEEVFRKTQYLIENVDILKATSNTLASCVRRNWMASAAKLTERTTQGLRDIPYLTSEIESAVERCSAKVPSVRDIYEDILQAEAEFEQFEYRKDGDLLVVTTDEIELDDVYLGEFEIRLHVPELGQIKRHGTAYRIVAIDPHPAGSNDSVTHPHVSDEHMCEGDAGAAIEAALSNGRICDFFMLVRSVLTTYNPNSPYVALQDWYGTPCYDCGYSMSRDDSNWCHACENDFCPECISYCRRCDESTCRGCLEECPVCGDLICSSCMSTCPDCGKSLCKNCLEDNQCPCVQEREEENEDECADKTARAASGRK